MRHPHDVELPVRVDRADPAPLPAQLVQQLRELVVSGTLRPGDALPSTRGLAARLGISRGSVVTAYDQLHGEGYLHATNGATVVHPMPFKHPCNILEVCHTFHLRLWLCK